MLHRMLALAGSAAVLGAGLSTEARPASAAPATCSHDELSVAGTPIAITLCPSPRPARTPGHEMTVTLDETFRAASGAFSRRADLEFLAGSDLSRTIDDVSLAPLGIAKTLHLTLSYRDGAVRIDHALLLPGAVPLR